MGASAAVKAAAKLCEERGWVEGTGEFQGTGKTAKELFRVTSAGFEFAISNSEPACLLSDLLDVVDAQRAALDGIRSQLETNASKLETQETLLQRLKDCVVPPDLGQLLSSLSSPHPVAASRSQDHSPVKPAAAARSREDWPDQAIDFVREYRRGNPLGSCPLPELFRGVAEPAGISIGQFHDGLRQLVRERRLRLHPWTGPMYQIQDEQYALMMGQEIKFYADTE
jgi:hypothetical protein